MEQPTIGDIYKEVQVIRSITDVMFKNQLTLFKMLKSVMESTNPAINEIHALCTGKLNETFSNVILYVSIYLK